MSSLIDPNSSEDFVSTEDKEDEIEKLIDKYPIYRYIFRLLPYFHYLTVEEANKLIEKHNNCFVLVRTIPVEWGWVSWHVRDNRFTFCCNNEGKIENHSFYITDISNDRCMSIDFVFGHESKYYIFTEWKYLIRYIKKHFFLGTPLKCENIPPLPPIFQ